MSTVSRGTAWASKVDQMLRRVGVVTRKAWLSAGDDMTVVRPRGYTLSVEAKNWKEYDFSKWVNQAVRQCPVGHLPVVVAHRNGKAEAEDGFVVMRGSDFVKLLAEHLDDGPGLV